MILPEGERLAVYQQLASSLPDEAITRVESARRVEEMQLGKVAAMSEEAVRERMASLRGEFKRSI